MAFDFRKFIKGIRLVPESASSATTSKGDLDVTTDGKLNYHNGTSSSPIVTEGHSATLINKTIGSSTGLNFSGSTSGATKVQASATASGTLTLPAATDTLVGQTTPATLTNKTIDGDDNTLQDVSISSLKTVLADANKAIVRDGSGIVTSALITDTNVNNTAAIARSKLASGTASHVIINDGSGVLSSEAQLAISRGGTGQSTATAAFDALSPATTTGDLIVKTNTGASGRFAVGTSGNILLADASSTTYGLSWASPASLIGNISVRALSTTQSLLSGDGLILATSGGSNITLTLPASPPGKTYYIKKVDAGAGSVIVNTSSGTIDSAASKTLAVQYQALTIASDGTNFYII